jgi:predicted MFS family arabinose efflux permease
MAAVFVVFGTELSVIAGLETSGQAGWIPAVNTVWCLASLTGGFVYGAVRRSPALPVLVAGLAAVTLPVSLGGPWWSFALLLVPAGLLCAPSLAASAEAVSGLAPEHARGLVTGLHGSAITLGGAVATPLTGLLIDHGSPAVAILTVGAVGLALAAVAGFTTRRRTTLRPSSRASPSAGSQPI